MESLIYDRVLSDITNLTSKGKFNASFLNRVESWTKYLNGKFNELGYRTENIKIYSKNVFNPAIFDGLTINADGTVKTTKYYADCVATILKLEPNTTYMFGTYVNGTVNNSVGFSVEVNGSWINYTWQSFTTDSNGEVSLKVGAGAWSSIGKFNFNVMLRKTTDDNVYVPYKETVVGYKERVAYIESIGTQWIDTNVLSNENCKVEVEFSGSLTIGNRTAYGSNEFRISANELNSTISLAYGSDINMIENIDLSEKHTVEFNGTGEFKLDGELIHSSTANVSSWYNIYMFKVNQNGTLIGGSNPQKIYECKIWQGEELVRWFIPTSISNRVACMYDKVSKTHYYNKGTGDFAYTSEWQIIDDFTLDEANRIINNINVLRSIIALYNDTPSTPETMRFLDYIKANNIEKILFDIDKLVNNMVANFRYSGTFYSGEVGLC